MSSLAAARADNFYFPPDFDPVKHGTLAGYTGQHPLRERAKKLKSDGILVIRFEMPYHIWCGCGKMIAQGVRFNAEKKHIGDYFSTKIWQFCMTAPCCQGRIEIHTDPKNTEYVVVSGGRRKVETYDAKEAGTQELPDPNEREKLRADPMARLEHGMQDERKAKVEGKPRIGAMMQRSEEAHRDDYTLNKALRRANRAGRKEASARAAEGARLGLPEHVRLLPASADDAEAAAAVAFRKDRVDGFEANKRARRQAIKSSSIFGGMGAGAAGAGAAGAGALGARGGVAKGGGGSVDRKAELLAKRRRLQGGAVLKRG